MKEKNYYNEINYIIETLEVSNKIRQINADNEKLRAFWEIGKIIVEAQGGETRAKYGNELIEQWSIKFTNKYVTGYSKTTLKKIRQYFIKFRKGPTMSDQLSWSHIVELLPIKNQNECNYYLNQVILNNLSVRELRAEIKSKSFNRLSYVDKDKIELITYNSFLTIKDMIKDPILIKMGKNINEFNEKVLHRYIINMLENKFLG